MAETPRFARSARRGSISLLAAIVLVLALSTAVLATHSFSDVPNANPHHDNISAIADAGVTTGFPDGTYRPGDLVRRDQMGSFMARLGGLGGNPPSRTPLGSEG